uniref:Uncharacterized protein n=1 Tax=Trichogramma kaykai TaxID=54128 RepID=A0ABD2WRM6_9HYME
MGIRYIQAERHQEFESRFARQRESGFEFLDPVNPLSVPQASSSKRARARNALKTNEEQNSKIYQTIMNTVNKIVLQTKGVDVLFLPNEGLQHELKANARKSAGQFRLGPACSGIEDRRAELTICPITTFATPYVATPEAQRLPMGKLSIPPLVQKQTRYAQSRISRELQSLFCSRVYINPFSLSIQLPPAGQVIYTYTTTACAAETLSRTFPRALQESASEAREREREKDYTSARERQENVPLPFLCIYFSRAKTTSEEVPGLSLKIPSKSCE